jgi:hypothetical protein
MMTEKDAGDAFGPGATRPSASPSPQEAVSAVPVTPPIAAHVLDALEAGLRALLRGKHSSLSIEFNDFASNYLTAVEAEREGWFRFLDWASADERLRALATNSVWRVQWYPETPVGFHFVLASTLAAAVSAASGIVTEGGDPAGGSGERSELEPDPKGDAQ